MNFAQNFSLYDVLAKCVMSIKCLFSLIGRIFIDVNICIYLHLEQFIELRCSLNRLYIQKGLAWFLYLKAYRSSRVM